MAKKKNDLTASPFAPLSLGKTTASTQSKPKAIMATAQNTQATRKAGQAGKNTLVLPTPSALIQAQAQKSAAKTAQPQGGPVKPKQQPKQGDGVHTGAGGVSLPVLRQINANSMAWHKADAQKRNALEIENAKLRAQAKLSYDDHTGRTLAGSLNLSAPVEVAHGNAAAKAAARQTLDTVKPLDGSIRPFAVSPAKTGAQFAAALPAIEAQKEARKQALRMEYAALKSKVRGTDYITDQKYRARMRQIEQAFDDENGTTLGGRLVSAARSIGENIIGAVPALGENLRQIGTNEAKNQKNVALLALRRQADALELELNSYYASGASAYGIAPEMIEKQKQMEHLRQQIEQAQDKTPVNQNKFGQRMMHNATFDAKQATEMPDAAKQFVAGTGLSIAQNVANLPLTAVNPALPLATMGAQAAAHKTTELNMAGSAPESALARGIVTGAIEAATEKIPLENVLRLAKSGGKGAFRELLKQSGIEAGEEGASYALNYLADKFANDPNATFDTRELAAQMAGGALSGAVMGGGGMAVNRATSTRIDPMQYGKTPEQAMQEQRAREAMPQTAETDTNFAQNKAAPVGTEPIQAESGQNQIKSTVPMQGAETQALGQETESSKGKLERLVEEEKTIRMQYETALGEMVNIHAEWGSVAPELRRPELLQEAEAAKQKLENKKKRLRDMETLVENQRRVVETEERARVQADTEQQTREQERAAELERISKVQNILMGANGGFLHAAEVQQLNEINSSKNVRSVRTLYRKAESLQTEIYRAQNQMTDPELGLDDAIELKSKVSVLHEQLQNTVNEIEIMLGKISKTAERRTKKLSDPMQYGKTPMQAVQEQQGAVKQDFAAREAAALLEQARRFEAARNQDAVSGLEAGEPLAVGDQVRDARVGNIGTVAAVNRDGTAEVTFRNAQTHATKTVSVRADQLERIAPQAPEVTPDSLRMAQEQREALDSDSYEIPGIIDAKEYAVREAENRETAQGQLDALDSKRYRQPDEEAAQRADHLRVGDNTETQALGRAWQDVKRAEAHRDNVLAEVKLSDRDKKFLNGALITGSTSNFYEADNPQDLLYAYEAEQAVRDARRPINEANAQRREAMDLEAAEHADAIATHAKDKVNGLAYERETMERNIFDIFGKEHRAEAETLNKTYFEPVHKAVAQGNKLKSGYRQRVTALNLDKHESALVQMMLEGEHGAAADYIKNNGIEITPERNVKLERARDTMREIYKELYDQINDALLRNGQEPVPYRQNYAPHFTIDKPDTAMGRLRYMLGLGKSADTLPTDIAGITENFRPGKKWFGNLLQRKGELTDFDAVYGFDQYVETAADVITLTDSVQRLRALEDAVRYRLSDEGTQAKIDAIQNNRELDALERLKEKEKVYDDNLSTVEQLKHEFINQKRMGMRGLVTELRRYTDSLAGKKSKDDRDMEDKLGRGIYELSRKVEGRVAANMIALNPGSWLTNFIPLTQASGEISTMNLLRGMRDTVTSYAKDDGFVDASAFLTNRRGSERMTGTTLQKVGNTLSKPMEFIDRFTADTIVRARAVQNMQRGLSFDDAMNEADSFAAGLMADRSKGAMPTLFNAKNPVTKAFTMFQLEVNNQLSYMGKDLTRRLGEDGAKAIAFALTKLFAGAFLYNKLYREMTGRDAAFDPVGAIAKAFGIGGDDGKERSASDVLLSLGKSAADQLPFVSGLIGGGRIPVSAALPNVGKLYTAATDGEKAPEKRLQMAAKELAKPAVYLLPPFGGGAVKKAVEGFRTVRDGGAYELDNDGNKQLLFPAYGQKPQDYLKAMAFGRYSSKEATDYVEDGFKRLSADNTKAYDALVAEGVDRKTAFDAIKALSSMKGDDETGTGEKKRQYIMSLDGLSAEQKRTLDKMTVSGDKPNNAAWYESPEEFKITSHMSGEDQVEARIRARLAMQAGVSADDYLRYEDLYKAKKKPFGVTDAKAREKVLDALEQDGSLDDEGKAKIAEYLLVPKMSDSRREDWEHYKGKISPQTFVKIADKYSEIQAKYDGYQKPEEDGYSGAQLQATEFAKWVDTLPVAADTKTAIKDDFASYSFVPAKPIAYDWDMLSSEDEKAHVAAMQKTGLSIATYNAIKKHASSFEADKDSDGKTISGSKKKKVIAYVQSNIALTEEQKRLVIEAMGYKTTSKEKSSKKSSVNSMTKGFPSLPVFK